jgi:hypothetical protein
MWGWLSVYFRGDRTYADEFYESGATESGITIRLWPDYLPSQTLECTAYNYGVDAGVLHTPQGTTYNIQHSNPACDSFAPRLHPAHAESSWWVSEELWNANDFIADAIVKGAGYYWTALGQEVFYSPLRTPEGGDVGFYPSWSLPPTVRAQFSVGSRIIEMNVVHFGSYNQGQWQAVASHELGHAIGFDHASTTDWSKTIMVNTYFNQEGLLPRTLDKCSTVQAFPVDLRR